MDKSYVIRQIVSATELRDRVKLRIEENEKILERKVLVKSDKILLKIAEDTMAYWKEELVHAK